MQRGRRGRPLCIETRIRQARGRIQWTTTRVAERRHTSRWKLHAALLERVIGFDDAGWNHGAIVVDGVSDFMAKKTSQRLAPPADRHVGASGAAPLSTEPSWAWKCGTVTPYPDDLGGPISPQEAFEAAVKAGIYTPKGNLRKPYR